jgi:trans-aconitate 2-methyltransferase
VPYYAGEDVEATLSAWRAAFRTTKSYYQLRFPDSTENRLKILGFLFGEYLEEISPQRLLGEFDRYVVRDHIEMNTHSVHFTVEA